MIWRRNESSPTVKYIGRELYPYPTDWMYEGITEADISRIPYHNKSLYEPFESDGLFKYLFTVNETIVMKRELKYAFDSTGDAIDFITDFLPVSPEAKAELCIAITSERNVVYREPSRDLTVNLKINNPEP